MADQKKITIENHITEAQPLWVFADPTRLKQALLNLVTNAVKYNREGGKVSLEGESVEGNRVRIHVIDNGSGIEESHHHSIFEPFERLGAERSGIEGTGIGLTITKKLVVMIDGTISIKSRPGEGSCFTIELPAGNISGEPIEEGRLSANDKSNSKEPEQCSQSILYIEDNKSSLKLVKNCIEDYSDFKFLSSPTAQGGMKIARENQPSLILMDINLPDIDGLTAFRKLQGWQETQSIPVVAISAGARDQDIKNALDMGFKDYLIKPVDLNDLMDAILKILNAPLQ